MPERSISNTLDLPAVANISRALQDALQHKIDTKTKPPGSLGQLEDLALQVGLIQDTLTPAFSKPAIVVFAGDHGLTAEGISPFPQEVTAQMVANFLAGGAAINAFAKTTNIGLTVVDAGVANDIPGPNQPVDRRVARGTANSLHLAAMQMSQMAQAIEAGRHIVSELGAAGTNVIGFGEMGIGNTSAAAAIMHLITEIPVDQCTGRGTGLDDTGLSHKVNILTQVTRRARANMPVPPSDLPLEVLRECGGFEIAMIVGAMLQAANQRMCIVVDGFIVGAALLVARALAPAITEYCVYAHVSNESGHASMLNHLQARALLNLGMRLGEGTGAALAMPLVHAAVTFLNDMASFESAGVSDRDDD